MPYRALTHNRVKSFLTAANATTHTQAAAINSQNGVSNNGPVATQRNKNNSSNKQPSAAWSRVNCTKGGCAFLLSPTAYGSGTYVCKNISGENSTVIQNARPLELVDARFALEPHICRLAVIHGRKKDFEKLSDLLDEMENNYNNPIIFGDSDTAFHRALAESTGNALLIWMIEQITSVRNQDEWSRMRHLTLNEKIIKEYNEQHRRILNAINAREPETAASMMREHHQSGS